MNLPKSLMKRVREKSFEDDTMRLEMLREQYRALAVMPFSPRRAANLAKLDSWIARVDGRLRAA